MARDHQPSQTCGVHTDVILGEMNFSGVYDRKSTVSAKVWNFISMVAFPLEISILYVR